MSFYLTSHHKKIENIVNIVKIVNIVNIVKIIKIVNIVIITSKFLSWYLIQPKFWAGLFRIIPAQVSGWII